MKTNWLVIVFVFLSMNVKAYTQIENQITPFIIGGLEVPSSDPVAQSTVLIKVTVKKTSYNCTGVILADDLILTAGHCLGVYGDANLEVYFTNNENVTGPMISVVKQLRAYGNNPEKEFDWQDVAILKLAQAIPAGYRAMPWLDDFAKIQTGTQILLAGFGRTTAGAQSIKQPAVLRAVKQVVLNPQYSQSEFLVSLKYKGSCYGDSGGPAMVETQSGPLLIGLTSRMTAKNRIPGQSPRAPIYECTVDMVYTNVIAMKKWIDEASRGLHH